MSSKFYSEFLFINIQNILRAQLNEVGKNVKKIMQKISKKNCAKNIKKKKIFIDILMSLKVKIDTKMSKKLKAFELVTYFKNLNYFSKPFKFS